MSDEKTSRCVFLMPLFLIETMASKFNRMNIKIPMPSSGLIQTFYFRLLLSSMASDKEMKLKCSVFLFLKLKMLSVSVSEAF